MARLLPLVATLQLVGHMLVVAQPVPQACCFGHGVVVYGADCYKNFSLVESWDDVNKCWALGAHHFSNKSSAEQFQIFSILLGSASSPSKHNLTASPNKLAYDKGMPTITGNGSTLVMDSSVVAAKLSPLNPMLPLFIQFVFPAEENTGACLPLVLQGWSIALTYKAGVPNRFEETSPTDWPLAIKFSGCGRDDSIIKGLEYAGMTWGQPSFFFVSIEASNVFSVDQNCNLCTDNPPANDALSFSESDLVSSTFFYFGDVTATIGDQYGRTQNGTFARDCIFSAKNPWKFVGAGYYMRTISATTRYSFSWYGTQTREYSATLAPALHMDNVTVAYIQDVSLGSVNVSRSHFDWWANVQNPSFFYASPPLLEVYNMESNAPPEKNFGSCAAKTVFRFAWSVSLRSSAFSECRWYWSRPANLHLVPYKWDGNEAADPSFKVDLLTNDAQRGFVQSLNQSFICRRVTPGAPARIAVPVQRVEIANTTTLYQSTVVPLGREYARLCLYNASSP